MTLQLTQDFKAQKSELEAKLAAIKKAEAEELAKLKAARADSGIRGWISHLANPHHAALIEKMEANSTQISAMRDDVASMKHDLAELVVYLSQQPSAETVIKP